MTMKLIKVAYDCLYCAKRHYIITVKGAQIKKGDIEIGICGNCGRRSKQLVVNVKPHSEFKINDVVKVLFT